jgi:hypothetical protein
MTNTVCCIYGIVPPDDEQQACSKHVEVTYWNRAESAWFILLDFIIQSMIATLEVQVKVHNRTGDKGPER